MAVYFDQCPRWRSIFEGTITKCQKTAPLARDDPLFSEISTDKVDAENPGPFGRAGLKGQSKGLPKGRPCRSRPLVAVTTLLDIGGRPAAAPAPAPACHPPSPLSTRPNRNARPAPPAPLSPDQARASLRLSPYCGSFPATAPLLAPLRPAAATARRFAALPCSGASRRSPGSTLAGHRRQRPRRRIARKTFCRGGIGQREACAPSAAARALVVPDAVSVGHRLFLQDRAAPWLHPGVGKRRPARAHLFRQLQRTMTRCASAC